MVLVGHCQKWRLSDVKHLGGVEQKIFGTRSPSLAMKKAHWWVQVTLLFTKLEFKILKFIMPEFIQEFQVLQTSFVLMYVDIG